MTKLFVLKSKAILIAITCLAVLMASFFAFATSPTTVGEKREEFKDPYAGTEKIVKELNAGTWEEGREKGSYRYVVTQYGEVNRLYLQWRVGDSLLHSVAVAALNSVPEYKIEGVSCQNVSCSRVQIQTVHQVEHTEQVLSLEIQALGRYILKLPNSRAPEH